MKHNRLPGVRLVTFRLEHAFENARMEAITQRRRFTCLSVCGLVGLHAPLVEQNSLRSVLVSIAEVSSRCESFAFCTHQVFLRLLKKDQTRINIRSFIRLGRDWTRAPSGYWPGLTGLFYKVNCLLFNCPTFNYRETAISMRNACTKPPELVVSVKTLVDEVVFQNLEELLWRLAF